MTEIRTEQLSAADPLLVGVEEIQLPSDDVMAEMIAEEEAAAAGATKPAPAARPDVATLAFTGGKMRQVVIPLAFPFEVGGTPVEQITVRRLTTYEVSEMAGRLPANFDNFDIYAAMTGLPAEVLRGLDDEDGDRVTTAGYDFLPRAFRPATAP